MRKRFAHQAMDESALYEILDQYFDSFQRKDVAQLRDLVANDICLRDWDTHAIGRDDFLTANQAIFGSFGEIRIKRIATDIVEKKAFCLIEVGLNDLNPITVMDVITVDEKRKIVSVEAYRQF